MIRIKMGGYVDENDKVMTKEELDAWIIKIQEESARLRKALEFYADEKNWSETKEYDEDLKHYVLDRSKVSQTYHWLAREALKGGR